ncbi:MAG TPA: hypothetical protein VNO75_01310 [Gemmatimonadaceae bacterium]|nr:hypothetical protein [Gemmatimonadaceae bacterium]
MITPRQIALPIAVFTLGCSVDTRPTVDRATMAQLWENPTDLERRDLFYGTGGAKNAPDPNELYEFKEEKAVGTQPGYDVEDSKGREWSVKLGPESKPEVAVSRLVWAIGYRQPSVYYLPRWTLVRDGKRIPHGGARFRLDDTKNLAEWSWRKNPFLHTRELAGLFVTMVMVNNWDVKSQQNALYEYKAKAQFTGPRQQYMVKDLGASLGRSAWPVGGTKADPAGFEDEPFIERVEGNRVRFGYQGAWLEPSLVRSITPADVRWTTELMSRLTQKQWSDAFRAAGFAPSEANRFISRLQQKIVEGRRLGEF